MDPLWIVLLIVLAIVVLVGAFALMRRKQRSGRVLASPSRRRGDGS